MHVSGSTPPVTAASAAANRHAVDFTALGATKVEASESGLAIEFADLDAARMAKALVNDAVKVEFGGARVAVPVTISGVTEAPTVGIEDAARAIGKLSGVWKTDTARNTVTATVMGDAATTRLDALLRDQVSGAKIKFDTVQVGAHEGWGGGF